jgi:Amidohydrolase family
VGCLTAPSAASTAGLPAGVRPAGEPHHAGRARNARQPGRLLARERVRARNTAAASLDPITASTPPGTAGSADLILRKRPDLHRGSRPAAGRRARHIRRAHHRRRQGGRHRCTGRPGTRVVDGLGRRVIPGLNDSHIHLIRGGVNYLLELRWDGVPSLSLSLWMLREQAERTLARPVGTPRTTHTEPTAAIELVPPSPLAPAQHARRHPEAGPFAWRDAVGADSQWHGSRGRGLLRARMVNLRATQARNYFARISKYSAGRYSLPGVCCTARALTLRSKPIV